MSGAEETGAAAGVAPPALIDAVGEQREWMVALLRRLLAAPSELGREELAQAIVEETLRELGLEISSHVLDADTLRAHPRAAPFDWELGGKRNVVGHWRPGASGSPGGGRSLTLSGHVDVPAPQSPELWTRPPYEPWVDDGRVVGWGILKSGLVAMLGALRAMRAAGLEPGATVRLQSVVEEETSGNGALAAALALEPLDGALVAGCLGESVPFAQLGVFWFTVRVALPPAHAGDGVATSAIDSALALVPALREHALRANAIPPAAYRDADEPIKLNVGAIRGGTLPSIGPGECEISCRIAMFPGERLADKRREIEQVVAAAAERIPAFAAHPPQVRFTGFSCEGYELPRDAPIVQALERAHAAGGGRPRLAALTTALDARTFHHLGIPATSAGPPVEQLHAIDEAVAIDELVRSTGTIARFVCDWCGVRRASDG
ncbi:M20/M25/M40 family metallo-hydrolase [Conexibacter arvalis]|uniref:Acetylornithine deacetylase n=1 Tax=Conexibacter arvalis TaxID=912552 RepID=A0A840IB30_9ACTN|nr:M20/M25/M40 family metallo-hydrolase [Conexibacter arvalis]MBB4662099.1 acetylornithine deacetylase [Conexibacter arvalis]